MNDVDVTDLKSEGYVQVFKIVLLGSRWLIENADESSQDLFLSNPFAIEKVYKDFIDFNLINVGTLNLVFCNHQIVVNSFSPSNQYMTLKKEIRRHDFSLETKSVLESEDGKIKLCTNLDNREVSELNLFLLLKQMVPELKIANYIDCKHPNFSCDHKHINGDQWADIRKLGVISLLKNGLIRKKSESKLEYYALGLTLSPLNISLINNISMFLWLKFLTVKKWEHDQKNLKKMTSTFLGPKMGW